MKAQRAFVTHRFLAEINFHVNLEASNLIKIRYEYKMKLVASERVLIKFFTKCMPVMR